ncbi:MAG TPA: prenyltransferase/squalene oxidase repeat-containing protein [Acidobacteriaceae bacterium]|nr:prenyltransferase/squalene oxidase repeat-containing protein [Acidobacteriaceae bacterium]
MQAFYLASSVDHPFTGEKLPVSRVRDSVTRFVRWLDGYGEESLDFQSYYASALGRQAKKLYYEHRSIGTLAVIPMVLSEAFFPGARRLFARPQRFPIADAHFAMGFAFLAQVTGQDLYYKRAVSFLNVLRQTRCPGYQEYCWGYPFPWETVFGTIPTQTPLITTIPYAYEAFQQTYRLDGDDRWRQIMHSIAQHVLHDYGKIPYSDTAASCTYTPFPQYSRYEVNANAYRASLLTNAAIEFSDAGYLRAAEENLNFVLETQNPDGSWYYSVDGRRTFVDHFHTCFVLKGLAKIEKLTGNSSCTAAIERGVAYYTRHLFDESGLPRPFSRAPRFTVYRRELYDYAECINLALLLQGRFPALDHRLSVVVDDILARWQKPDGSFRSRQLRLGWDNTPMHRWAASQLFRSLSFLISTQTSSGGYSARAEA